MSHPTDGRTPDSSALDAVLALETRLGDRHRVEQEAQAHVSAARAEADLLLVRARHDAELEADERHRRALADADAAAERIVSAAHARADAVREQAASDRPDAVRVVIAQIMPPRGGGA